MAVEVVAKSLLLMPPETVRMGSGCSGYAMMMGLPVVTALCSENDRVKRAILRAVYRLWDPQMVKPKFRIFRDLVAATDGKPPCDIYIVGPPVPPSRRPAIMAGLRTKRSDVIW
jgi:hypothetical protein